METYPFLLFVQLREGEREIQEMYELGTFENYVSASERLDTRTMPLLIQVRPKSSFRTIAGPPIEWSQPPSRHSPYLQESGAEPETLSGEVGQRAWRPLTTGPKITIPIPKASPLILDPGEA